MHDILWQWILSLLFCHDIKFPYSNLVSCNVGPYYTTACLVNVTKLPNSVLLKISAHTMLVHLIVQLLTVLYDASAVFSEE